MFGKIFVQMYDGSLGTRGPWQALVTFQQLIVLADRDGTVDMTAEVIARRTSIPLEVIQIGLKALAEPDPASRTPDFEGRRIVPISEHRDWGWRLVNYAKYRSIRSAEERREYNREYWHKRKDRQNQGDSSAKPLNGASNELNHSTGTHQTQPIAEAEADGEAKQKQKTTPRAPAFARSQWIAPADVPQSTWDAWLDVRQASPKRPPWTENAYRVALRKLDELRAKGYKAHAMVETAAANAWVGFWESRRTSDMKAAAAFVEPDYR